MATIIEATISASNIDMNKVEKVAGGIVDLAETFALNSHESAIAVGMVQQALFDVSGAVAIMPELLEVAKAVN